MKHLEIESPDHNDILMRLRHHMQTNGIKQAAVCKKIGMASSNMSRLFTGQQVPSLNTFIKLCDAVDITPNQALGIDHLPGVDIVTDRVVRLPAPYSDDGSRLLEDVAEICHRSDAPTPLLTQLNQAITHWRIYERKRNV